MNFILALILLLSLICVWLLAGVAICALSAKLDKES